MFIFNTVKQDPKPAISTSVPRLIDVPWMVHRWAVEIGGRHLFVGSFWDVNPPLATWCDCQLSKDWYVYGWLGTLSMCLELKKKICFKTLSEPRATCSLRSNLLFSLHHLPANASKNTSHRLKRSTQHNGQEVESKWKPLLHTINTYLSVTSVIVCLPDPRRQLCFFVRGIPSTHKKKYTLTVWCSLLGKSLGTPSW